MGGRLDDALLLQRGFDLPIKKRQRGTVPIYAATGLVGFHDEAKVNGPGVITGRSGSLGTVQFVDEDFWPLNTTLWVKEFRRVTPLYAFYLLEDLELEAFNSGAAVPTLNRNDVHGLSVVLPPTTVLEHFEYHVAPLYGLKQCLGERINNLRSTRDLLLPKLISGEIEVRGIGEPDGRA
jgi:type I restriction enzyme S subunit